MSRTNKNHSTAFKLFLYVKFLFMKLAHTAKFLNHEEIFLVEIILDVDVTETT